MGVPKDVRRRLAGIEPLSLCIFHCTVTISTELSQRAGNPCKGNEKSENDSQLLADCSVVHLCV